MDRYAVALSIRENVDEGPDTYWIEFYYADDSNHAYEQARNANPEAEILCVATVII